MDNLKAMEAYAAVVRCRSYAQAAESLGVSRAVVTKYVMQLESHLGARLLNRTTRRVSPTEVGEDYYRFCTGVLDEIRDKEAAIAAGQREAEGTVRVMAPKSFGSLYLGRVFADFVARYPNIHVSLFLTDLSLRTFDLVESGSDLAIRLTAQADSSLVSRRIGTARWVLCAAPGFHRRAWRAVAAGRPARPALRHAHALAVHAARRRLDLPRPGRRGDGQGHRAVHGQQRDGGAPGGTRRQRGALLPTYCIGPDLKAGTLRGVLPGYAPPAEEISVIFPHRTLLPQKSRLVIDFLAEAFQPPPWDRA